MSSRVKLPPLEGAVPPETDANELREAPPISLHNELPLFDQTFVQATLSSSNQPSAPGAIWLPPHMQTTVCGWKRIVDVLDLPKAPEEELRKQGLIKDEVIEDEVTPAIADKGKDKADKGKEKGGKEKGKEKGKDKKGEKDKKSADDDDNTDEATNWVEYDIDPTSHKYLPRVIMPLEKPHMEAENLWRSTRRLSRPFVKFWTEEQRKRAEVDRMLAESNLPTSYDKLVNEARRKGVPPPEPPQPEGPFKDELMVSVFSGVAQMIAMVDKTFSSGGGNGNTPPAVLETFDSVTSPGHATSSVGLNEKEEGESEEASTPKIEGDYFPFMWDAIYPKDASGKPCYNPNGIYVVRVWAAGAWRAVVVDDHVPLNFKGECIFAATEETREIWPMLLSKALYVVLGASSFGSRTGDTFSIIPHARHGSAASLSCGGVFGFLLQGLTGWQPNMPKTLTKLAEEPAQGDNLPAGFAESEDGSVGNEDLDVSAASLSLLRYLIADGVPCAPLEQFKFDEIYRSQVSAALGRDPFLVDSSQLKKWPRPPDKRKKGKKKSGSGSDLLSTLRAAAVTRERRVKEIREKIFDALERPRLYALCASSVPEPEVVGEDQAQLEKKRSKKESKRLSRLTSKMSGGESNGSLDANSLDGDSSLVASVTTDNSEYVNSDLNSVATQDMGEEAFNNPVNEEVLEGEEEEEIIEDNNIPISNRLSGALNSVRPIARLRAMQNQGPPLYPETRVNCHMILAIGLRASTMPLPVVEATDLGKFGGDGNVACSARRLNWLRGEIKPADEIEELKALMKAKGSIISKDGTMNNFDDQDTCPEPKLLVLWRDPEPYKEASVGSTPKKEKVTSQVEGTEDEDQEGAAVHTDGGSATEGSDAELNAKTAEKRKKRRERKMGVDDEQLPEFSPSHPAMAKGNLRWMTPSTFIKAMGGPDKVSLLQVATRFHMASQEPEKPLNPTPTAPPTKGTKGSSASAAAAAVAAASSKAPSLNNHIPCLMSDAPKVNVETSGSPTLLTLRHHVDTKTNKHASDREPTLLRIITPGSEEAEDEASQNSANERKRMIRLLVSIDVDPASKLPPTIPEVMAPSPPASAPSAPPRSGSIVSSSNNLAIIPIQEFNGDAQDHMEDNGDERNIEATGSLFLRPVSFIPANPTNEDEDEEDDDDFVPEDLGSSLKSAEELTSPTRPLDLSSLNKQGLMNNGLAVNTDLSEMKNDHTNISMLRDDDETILASVHASSLIAWVKDWKVPHSGGSVASHGSQSSLSLEEGSDFEESQSTLPEESIPETSLLPSGCYRHSVRNMPDGCLLLKLPQFQRKTSASRKTVDGKLPFTTLTADMLLPPLPRQSRSTSDSRGTDSRSFNRDYFFEVVTKLPFGGSISFSCSEKMVLGTAQEVWGTALRTSVGTGTMGSAKQEAADKLAKKEGYPHARSASGCYPALPSTVPPSMQSSRDRRGLGDYNENYENFAVLFRYRVKVIPPKSGDGTTAAVNTNTTTAATPVMSDKDSEDEEESDEEGGGGGAASATLLDDVIGPVTECGSRLKLHLSCPEARRYVRLVTVGVNASDATKVSLNFPLLETPPLRWRSDAKEGYVVMAILEKPPHVTLPPGSWSLVCLADAPISTLVSLEKHEQELEAKHAEAAAESAMVLHRRLNSLFPESEENEDGKEEMKNEGSYEEEKMVAVMEDKTSKKKGKSDKGSKGGSTANIAASSSSTEDQTKPKLDQMVWKLPHGPMARVHRWGGVYQPNKELKLMSDLLHGGSTDLTLHVEAFPSTKSPIPNFALRLKVFQKVKRAKQPPIDGIRPAPFNPRATFECIADVRGMDHITLELVHVSSSGIVIELSLDERRMVIPSILRSNKSFSMLQLENIFNPEEITWSSPKWRLMALPSSALPLQLVADPTIKDWTGKLQSKWHDLRRGEGGMGSISEPMSEPFWLKGNDYELEERKQEEAVLRKKYKAYLERVKKGIKKNNSTFVSGSLPANSVGQNSAVRQSDVNSWFQENLPPPPIADRIKEQKELVAMFAEDDRTRCALLQQQVNRGEKFIEMQSSAMIAMKERSAAINTEWSEKRNQYRVTTAARKTAFNDLSKIKDLARALGEGEKGNGLEGGGKSGKDDKNKKSSKKK